MFKEVEQPESFDQRRELAAKTCDELKIATTVVIDDMDNSVRQAYGRLPNSAYVIDKGGKIAFKEAWAKPDSWPDILHGLLAEEGS